MNLDRLHQLMDQEDWPVAKREAERLLLFQGQMDARQRARLYRAAARISLGMNEPYAAVQLAEMALEEGRRVADRETVIVGTFDLAHAHAWIGNLSDAQDCLQRFATLIQDGSWRHLEPRSLFNTGLLFRRMNRYDDAVEMYERAAELFRRLHQEERAIQAVQNAAWCYLIQKDAAGAEPYMHQVDAWLAAGKRSDNVEAEHLCQQALLFRLHGKPDAALVACETVFSRYGQRESLREYTGQAAWILGELMLDAGNFSEARIFTNLAMQYAQTCKWMDLVNLIAHLNHRLESVTQA